MPFPVPPLVVAFLGLGALALAIVGRETLARLDHALGDAASAGALAAGAMAGAALSSEPVSVALTSGLLRVGAVSPAAAVYALLAALAVAAGLHATFPAGLGGFPFSGTQAVVGALVGAGLAAVGPAVLGAPWLAATAAAWILVPPAAALAARGLAGEGGDRPALAWAVLAVPAAFLLAAPHDPGRLPGLAAAAALVLGGLVAWALARWGEPLEGSWGRLAAVGVLGLAVGASDAANVLGPVAAALGIVDSGTGATLTGVPLDLRLIAGGALVLGFVAWTPDDLEGGEDHDLPGGERGLVALAGGAALPVAAATGLGIPVSGTAAVVGAAAGASEVDLAGPDAPWRRLAAGAAAWTLLAGMAAAFLAGFLVRLLT